MLSHLVGINWACAAFSVTHTCNLRCLRCQKRGPRQFVGRETRERQHQLQEGTAEVEVAEVAVAVAAVTTDATDCSF